MAVVQGIKERVHLPIYDSLSVDPQKQLRDTESTSVIKFFVNVQGKSKLETNLQSASLLPHYNTFEARAMRVVISDLPPEFPDVPPAKDTDTEIEVEGPPTTDDQDTLIYWNPSGSPPIQASPSPPEGYTQVTAAIRLSLDRMMELLREARDSEDGYAELDVDEDGITLSPSGVSADPVGDAGGSIWLSVSQLEGYLKDLNAKGPPMEQIRPNDGAGNLISRFIYSTVTTFYVGEKIMIQMPTWFFPGGAGAYSEGARFMTHGEPSPMATFRFAEPIFIDKQQNFRVEIEIPDSDVLKEIQKIYGPFIVWVVLDGYMTRDVQ